MEKMIAAQKSLEKALLILIENDDNEEKQRRIYQECLCTITQESFPKLLRMDYFDLLRLVNVPFTNPGTSLVELNAHQELHSLLPMAMLLLYKRLTEWIAIENYLRSQQHIYSQVRQARPRWPAFAIPALNLLVS